MNTQELTIEQVTLTAIEEVKAELRYLKVFGTKEQQLECFKRLVSLYGALNIEKLIHITNKALNNE